MTQFKQYNPTASKSKKRPQIPEASATTPDNTAKQARFSSSTSRTMTANPQTLELVDIHARLSPSTRMDLALRVLDVGNLSITRLLNYRLDSAEMSHFENSFFSEGGGLETFLNELIERYPAAAEAFTGLPATAPSSKQSQQRWSSLRLIRYSPAQRLPHTRCATGASGSLRSSHRVLRAFSVQAQSQSELRKRTRSRKTHSQSVQHNLCTTMRTHTNVAVDHP